MGVSHVKNDGFADFTGTVTVWDSRASTTTAAATDLVRPSDWNSLHNLSQNLSGNTAGTSQVAGTDVIWAGGSNVTLSANGSTISIIGVPAPNTISSYVAYEIQGLASVPISFAFATTSPLLLSPMTIGQYVAADRLNMMASMSFVTAGTSSGRESFGIWYGLYTRGAGANTSQMSLLDSGSMGLSVTYNNSTLTINYPASTNSAGYTTSTTSSAGLNATSLFTGLKLLQFPIGQTLTPGVYWLGLMGTKSTNSNNCGFSLSFVGASMTNTVLAPINAHTSNFTTGTGFAADNSGGPWAYGFGSYTSAAGQTSLPPNVTISAMTAGLTQFPWIKFWSTT